ncbi:hypothetical protein LTR66_008477 [Elasticomyces elasticus]|nr:hypothetical protein LTR66_008477 [Elasticomyces elasticus]KAK4985833.1 hypothetical protein LTR50_005687 [Elasticomyces elasticus]
MLFEIVIPANHMDIKALLDIGCKTVANMIKGKSSEEIRQTFNIQNDLTPKEEDQIRRECGWADNQVIRKPIFTFCTRTLHNVVLHRR